MPTPLDDRRNEILAACMDACERGDRDAVERACHEWPELAGEIRAAAEVMAEIRAARGEPSAPAAVRIPATVGRFRILGQLGQGGMGIVYRAHDPLLDREVALKVQPTGLTASRRAAERFRREARVLAQIRHPHIVAIHDVGETVEGLAYFAMHLVEGKPLGQILSAAASTGLRALRAEQLLPEPGTTHGGKGSYLEAAVRLVAKVADALQHAHQEGITHRDVKPSNLIVDCAGEPHLVDFGIARDVDSASATSPDTLAGAGTPAYMAPEQITEGGSIGPWTDVYALGVTLYELITLQRPFAAATNQQVLRRILEVDPRSPRKINPSVSRELETICLTALEKDPRRRYSSARAFAEDLGRLLAKRPICAQPPGPVASVVKFVRRNPWPVAVAGVAVLAAVGGVIGQGVNASFDRREAHQLVELVHQQVMQETADQEFSLESAIVNLRRADELMPDEEPGRDLIEDLERNLTTRNFESLLATEIARCRELRNTGGRSHEIEQRTDAMLAQWNELVLRFPDSEVLGRILPELLEERRLVMRPAAQLGAAELAFDAQAADAGKGTIALLGGPPGARAHLFRYEECMRGGTIRDVPVPVLFSAGAAHEALPPGDTALVVERVVADGPAARAGIRAGDLILAAGGTLVDIEAFARLSADRGLELRIWSDGVVRNVTLRGDRHAGIEVRATAYPLACSPDNRFGTLPACRVAVAPGSYLVLVRNDQNEDLRLPVQVEWPGERQTLRAELQPADTSPPGFAYVAAGEFLAGAGGTSRPMQRRWLEGFWIGRNEVTSEQYLEFLLAPSTQAEIERSRRNGKRIRVPRGRGLGESELRVIHRLFWRRRADGSYEADRDLRLPISAVSCEDGEAYCRWLTQRARERNEPWLFRLPTEDEWEKAARGVDGRAFPWGTWFDANLCWLANPLRSHQVAQPQLPWVRPLGDESPFGVRDMAGGVLEWCAGSYLGTPQRPWRSGAWGNTDPDYSRCASSNGGLPWRVDEKDGFRVVAVRRQE